MGVTQNGYIAHTKLLACTVPNGVKLVLGEPQPRFNMAWLRGMFSSFATLFPKFGPNVSS